MKTSYLALFVQNLQLWTQLPESDREAILALPVSVRTHESSTYLIREAEPAGDCMVLLSGFAYRSKLSGDGSRQIVSLHVPGDALDLQNLFLAISDHSAQMLTRGEVAYIPRKQLQILVRCSATFAEAVFVKTLVEASIFREWILNIGRRNARARVAHLLCELAVMLEAQGLVSDYGYELPMTQEQIGDAVGLTAVHVNRTLKSLEAEGLITRTKRSIGFPDWPRLRLVGDFNQRYLHLPLSRVEP